MRITAKQALQRIQGTGMRKAKGAQMSLLRSITSARKSRLFVFGDGVTEKVCPAESDLPPVLAEYAAAEQRPPALNAWLIGLAKEVKYYQEKGRKTVATATETAAPRMAKAQAAPLYIAPLLGGIQWGQSAPWWNNIIYPNPNNPKKNVYCLTGCVATAMAQVLYYWAKRDRRRGCMALPAYTTRTNKYNVAALPGIAMFDYDNMTDTQPVTTAGKKAVAEFMRYVSNSVSMDFGYSRSGAYMAHVAPALKTKFAIPGAERVELRYTTTPKFTARIIAELEQGRPVIMGGGSASVDGAHTFVCDGYDSETGMFHFNWGWCGNCDGWFLLTALTTDNGDYTTKKNAIVGIMPAPLGDVNNDGKINMADISASIKARKEYNVNADVNFDGQSDETDTQLITNKILTGEGL